MKILTWGTGAGVRLNKDVLEKSGFEVGQEVDLFPFEDGVIIRPARPVFDIAELASRITRENQHELTDSPLVGAEVLDD